MESSQAKTKKINKTEDLKTYMNNYMKSYMKFYRVENKDKLYGKIECKLCNIKISKTNKSAHEKSKAHQLNFYKQKYQDMKNII